MPRNEPNVAVADEGTHGLYRGIGETHRDIRVNSLEVGLIEAFKSVEQIRGRAKPAGHDRQQTGGVSLINTQLGEFAADPFLDDLIECQTKKIKSRHVG